MTLDIITADSLAPMRHGFYGRAGGASSGIFAGLNCGYGSSDQRESVTLNRARVAASLDVVEDALVGVHQIHSPTVITVTKTPAALPKADAIVTATPGIALSILTADCQPVLFADAEAGVIGAAHAGWKGAKLGVLSNTVEAMVTLGARREAICAVIGPCISQRAYEVGPEFFEDFVSDDPENTRFFAGGRAGKMQFDLPSFGLAALRAAGLKHVSWTGHCTYSDPERFFSYRRATHAKEADYGRLIAAIRL